MTLARPLALQDKQGSGADRAALINKEGKKGMEDE
jgi:hypothetical protein